MQVTLTNYIFLHHEAGEFTPKDQKDKVIKFNVLYFAQKLGQPVKVSVPSDIEVPVLSVGDIYDLEVDMSNWNGRTKYRLIEVIKD
jgi:hypothetical protein